MQDYIMLWSFSSQHVFSRHAGLFTLMRNCRRPNEMMPVDDEDDPLALPRGKLYYPAINHFQNLLSQEIEDYIDRHNSRPQLTHEPGSLFWNCIPFYFEPNPFNYYYTIVDTCSPLSR